METNPAANRSKIASIVAEYMGDNRKVSDCTEEDAPQLDLIVQELRSLI